MAYASTNRRTQDDRHDGRSTRDDRGGHGPAARQGVGPLGGGLVGTVLEYVVARKVLGKVARVGGIKGMVLSAAATYAINRYLTGRRR